jgi:hypothetical protein
MTTTKTPKQPGGLAGYTTRWNELAAEANSLGLKVKLHKVETRPGEPSTFPSYAIAEARVAWLEAQIAAVQTTAKGMDEIKAAAKRVTKKAGGAAPKPARKLPETTAPLDDLPVEALKAAKRQRKPRAAKKAEPAPAA